jgi:hypothetical protein
VVGDDPKEGFHFRGAQKIRAASPPVDLNHLSILAQQVGNLGHLFPEIIQILGSLRSIRGDDNVAAAVVAKGITKGDMEVEGKGRLLLMFIRNLSDLGLKIPWAESLRPDGGRGIAGVPRSRSVIFDQEVQVHVHFFRVIHDAIVKSRHTRESGYPGYLKLPEKTGFPLSRE